MLGVLIVNDPETQDARRLECQPPELPGVLVSKLLDAWNASHLECRTSWCPSCSMSGMPTTWSARRLSADPRGWSWSPLLRYRSSRDAGGVDGQTDSLPQVYAQPGLGHPDVQTAHHLGCRPLEIPDVLVFRLLDVWNASHLECRLPWCPSCSTPGMPATWNAGRPGVQVARCPECQPPGVPDVRARIRANGLGPPLLRYRSSRGAGGVDSQSDSLP
jgi:hypothetical protein